MNRIADSLHAADERWSDRTSWSVWSAAAIVAVAWGLVALTRLGGLALTDPRAFVRFTVVGIWGWLALGVALWLVLHVYVRVVAHDAPVRPAVPLGSLLTVAGWAHTPIVVLGLVVFIAAGALQLLGPGLAAAVVVFAVAIPFALVTGVRHVADSSLVRAIAMVAIPYAVWLLVVIRHQLESIQHLL